MIQTEQCNRCDEPQGRVVLLDNREHVCGACITQIVRKADVSQHLAVDLTPSIECGIAA